LKPPYSTLSFAILFVVVHCKGSKKTITIHCGNKCSTTRYGLVPLASQRNLHIIKLLAAI